MVIDEHIADIIMRCNSHGIKTYYCCAGHSLNLFYIKANRKMPCLQAGL